MRGLIAYFPSCQTLFPPDSDKSVYRVPCSRTGPLVPHLSVHLPPDRASPSRQNVQRGTCRIGNSPYIKIVDPIEGHDIDYPYEFDLARKILETK